MSEKVNPLGSVLVIGGCGFIGFHVVDALLQQPDCTSITVVSRNPDRNRLNGVSYVAGDITDKKTLLRIVKDVRPQVVFDLASPRANDSTVPPAEHYATTIEGTKTLVSCLQATPSVKALIYTSTTAVAAGYQHHNISETAPLWSLSSSAPVYFKAKAFADNYIRQQNGPGLKTCTLRLPMVYGERDTQYIPGQLAALNAGQTKIQLGDGKNCVEPTYVGNVAAANILAARKLLEAAAAAGDKDGDKDGDGGVAGEAFHITDGDPQPFWAFTRQTWAAAQPATPLPPLSEIIVVPAWLALSLATLIERAFWICTFGRVRPPLNISRLFIQYTVYESTYCIEKARRRLGYEPVGDRGGRRLREAVQWEIRVNGGQYPNIVSEKKEDGEGA